MEKQGRGRPTTWQLAMKETVWAHKWLSRKKDGRELSETASEAYRKDFNTDQLNDFIDNYLSKGQRRKLQIAIAQARYRSHHQERGHGHDDKPVTIQIPRRIYDRLSAMATWRHFSSPTKFLLDKLAGIWEQEWRQHKKFLRSSQSPPDPLILLEDQERKDKRWKRYDGKVKVDRRRGKKQRG
ncbi:MAG TPA: hypothetical protein ENK33_00315 [Desulfobacterales bacterium]|nr:hypothetical protein [Desulfobacterales bacterium]